MGLSGGDIPRAGVPGRPVQVPAPNKKRKSRKKDGQHREVYSGTSPVKENNIFKWQVLRR